jgi:asparagine synthase (glutamine-hydrolysing)
MCGLFGFLANVECPEIILKTMGLSLQHRGPDDHGIFIEEKLGLGHNRLSIIDRSIAGHQPMTLGDKSLVLLFNGAIFNYKELRQELSDEPFISETDSEVLLRGYKKWGKQYLQRLNGMFAFVIWDKKRKTLFLARDRFGIKPLYYSSNQSGFFFASEPKGLFAAGISRQANLTAWSTYLVNGTYEHSESTFFGEVNQLKPGHSMTVAWNGDIKIENYYNLAKLALTTAEKLDNEKQISDEYFSILTNAVDICFRSDVPVGISISGGVDSSILMTAVHQSGQDPSRTKAFTYTCGDSRYDEVSWAAKLLKDHSHPWHISETASADIPRLISKVIKNQEEPFGGFNTLCFSELCSQARQEHVTVLLDGNGLDEQWAGYDYYSKMNWTNDEYNRGPVQGSRSLPVRPNCLNPGIKEHAELLDFPRPFENILDNLRYRDLVYTKIPRALRFSDRASMMHSIELRVPFLDYRLVEYSFKLAPLSLIHNGEHKYLLRKMAEGNTPRSILNAPKRPLQTPQREWLANELTEFVGDIISSRGFRELGWFDMKSVDEEWNQFQNSRVDNSFFVWQWISAALLAS